MLVCRLLAVASWLVCVLSGKGSAQNWKFGDVLHLKGPNAMAFLSGIQRAVVFGTVQSGPYLEYTYVATMTLNNTLSNYTTLEGVLAISSAIAHPNDLSVVLVAGKAESGGNETDEMTFVGALSVDGDNSYNWLMFELMGLRTTSNNQQMYGIEVLSDLNMFVAAGFATFHWNEGVVVAAYDLDDFSQVYVRQLSESSTFYWSLDRVALARIGSSDLALAIAGRYGADSNYRQGLCRFSATRDTVTVIWCQTSAATYNNIDYSIKHLHVVANSTILATGTYRQRVFSYNFYHPFVAHFNLDGGLQARYSWYYGDNDYGFIYTSFLDHSNNIAYLGGRYSGYNRGAVILEYDVSSHQLKDVRMWNDNQLPTWENYFKPKVVVEMVKADSGELMVMCSRNKDDRGLVTMTHTDCFGSRLSGFKRYDKSSSSWLQMDAVFVNYAHTDVLRDYDFAVHPTVRGKALCSGGSILMPTTTVMPTTTKLTTTVIPTTTVTQTTTVAPTTTDVTTTLKPTATHRHTTASTTPQMDSPTHSGLQRVSCSFSFVVSLFFFFFFN